MGDLDLGITAVDPPERRIVASSVRRHRSLTGVSGMLLFACMFLPAVRGCHDPVTPLDVPTFLPPYCYGLVFAVIALARTRRAVRYGVIALRVLALLVVASGIVLALIAPPIGIVELLIGAVLLATVGASGGSEHRLAATGITIATVCVAWFGMWSATPDALVGVYLSLASSLGLLAGSIFWMCELVIGRPGDVPRAVLRRGRR